MVRKYLGTIVPGNDNFCRAECGSRSMGHLSMFPKAYVAQWSYPPIFALTPRKPVSLSAILVADEGSYVSYIEAALHARTRRLSAPTPR
ncbi:hypothetical protein KCP77_15770 [Salmonella enterica subsp. enterica]|nr:hypothetical protein KCP77_15770 [Salmonella enterica subsp. enterica]